MISVILETVASLVECYLIVRFLVLFLGYKTEEHRYIKSVAAFAFIAADNLLVPLVINSDLFVGLCLLVICIVYSFLWLKGSTYIKVFAVFLCNVLIIIVNSLVLAAFTKIYNVSVEELILSRDFIRFEILLVTKFLFFVSTQLLLTVCGKKEYMLNRTEWSAVLIIFVTSLVETVIIFEVLVRPEHLSIACMLSLCGLVLINVLVYFLMVKNSKNNREKRQGDLLELQLSEQKERIVEINEMYGEILQIRHDIRKCIGCACVLMQQGNYNEASEYLEKLRDEKIGTVTEYVFLENQALNAIMNSRLTICGKENIDMRVSMFDCVGSFSEMDITILIANMLDNAIESCRKVEDARKIIFSVEKNKGYTSFSLINTAPESESENKKLRTTKGDTKNHGYGIKTMKEIAEKYDGMYNFHYENNNFYTDIWLREPSG